MIPIMVFKITTNEIYLFLCVWTGMQPLCTEVINDSTVASLYSSKLD